jgi:hypothetical protein
VPLDLRARVRRHLVDVVGGQLCHDIELSLQKTCDPRANLWNGTEDDAIHIDLSTPVVRHGFQHNSIILDPFDQAHGPRANRLGAKRIGTDLFEVCLRKHLPSEERQPRGQERVGLLGVEQHRVRIGRFDPLDGREDRRDQGLSLGVVSALNAELDIGGAEGIAIVKLHVRPELELPGRRTRELPTRG